MKNWTSGPGGEIVRQYRSVLSENRTRRVRLLGRKCRPEIHKTFLGHELLMGRTRLQCPDLPTARYLKIFAEMGCREIALPYDPTVTAALVPGLEQLVMDLKEECAGSERLRSVYRSLRSRLRELELAEPTGKE
jgi:hypothetical protein